MRISTFTLPVTSGLRITDLGLVNARKRRESLSRSLMSFLGDGMVSMELGGICRGMTMSRSSIRGSTQDVTPPSGIRTYTDHSPRPVTILLDVDTGADDALALLLALRSPALDVRAITCVAGNHELSNVVDNTLRLLDLIDAPDVPVAAGMTRPLIEAMRPPFPMHGSDGMADLDLPAPRRSLVDPHAVELLHHTLHDAAEPLTIVALAPLTNIAVFLRMYPGLYPKIARIVSMGGTFRVPGNTSPTAEFNVRQDPEAAAIVLESGLPVTLYPLDPFRQVRFHRDEIARFLSADDIAAQTAGRILLHMCDYFPADTSLIGDAGTVAMVIDPGGRHDSSACRLPSTWRVRPIAGRTVFDQRSASARATHSHWWQTSPAEIDVVVNVDADRYRRLFAEALGVSLGRRLDG